MANQANQVDRRAEILGDPAIHQSVRTVARLRGMQHEVARDIAQQVLLEALTDENLPVDDKEQARLYLGGCARHKAIDWVRSQDVRENKGPAPGETAEPDPETSAIAARVWQVVAGRFPGKCDMLFRHLILGETHAEIAGWYGKNPSTVRSDIARMMQALRNTTFACAFLMMFVGGRSTWERMTRPAPEHQLSDAVVQRHEAPPVEPSAEQLRDRARDWCRQKVWDECAEDLDRARRLDPAGETEELWQLRLKARDREQGTWAKPGFFVPPNKKNK